MKALARGLRAWVVAAGLVLMLGPSAEAAGLHVIPFPGTPDASPQTQIIFSALRPGDLGSVSVTGSRSGAHTGRLSALPDGYGTAFFPQRVFSPGERVDVVAHLRSPAGGTASGDAGATVLRFSFGVATPAGGPGPHAPAARPAAARPTGRTQRFHSQVNFHPPAIGLTRDLDRSPGDFFLTAFGSGQGGPMILNRQGQLVWFDPLSKGGAFNLEVQRYQGQPVLTYWQGNVVDFHGSGQDVILDRSYRPVAVVHAGNGYSADLHEFQITPQGTALIDDYVPVKANLTSVGGPASGSVYDCVIQEIDIPTGQVLWEWHSLAHVAVGASYRGKPSSRTYQYFHLNSIQQLPNGNLLISARNTWAVYEISKQTGQIIWTVGGKHSSFHLGARAKFEWQHDGRLHGNVLTVFDDASAPREEPQSSVKVIRLNTHKMTASLVRRYIHSPPLLAYNQGNGQTLPSGNVVVGWGSESEFSELSPGGRQIFNGSFPIGVTTYRAYRFRWSAQPVTRPSLAISPGSIGDVHVYASWNGATQVARWRVLGGAGPSALHWFDQGARTGFETSLHLHSQPRYFAVQALDWSGRVLGTSAAHRVPAHLAIFGPRAFASSSGGRGEVPVGCFTGQDCHVGLTVSTNGRVISRLASQPISDGTGSLLYFGLGAAGRRTLRKAADHGLPIQVTARDSSGRSATAQMTLIPYSISGARPHRAATQSPTVHIASTLDFATSTGRGAILAACYAQSACRIAATISVQGQVIATTQPQHLGANELGDIYFSLNQTGHALLDGARGNQLGAQVKLSDGAATASGDVDLVRYGS